MLLSVQVRGQSVVAPTVSTACQGEQLLWWQLEEIVGGATSTSQGDQSVRPVALPRQALPRAFHKESGCSCSIASGRSRAARAPSPPKAFLAASFSFGGVMVDPVPVRPTHVLPTVPPSTPDVLVRSNSPLDSLMMGPLDGLMEGERALA